ncbi:YjbH domain-containing protein [Alloyangia pacifica]|uniref:Exopolysaccharide biosynthesis protein YbjH n=1 Tax=Alloyangia pacifica TaxID=311180 RepID=A0A1I6U145_9RHOB|nr:YjbH domain-containing protein [Alloyangia pacifica]SDH33053.1 Exopolysaccharide biosynthesis protein YbjH [Alloyangia pacifica]SFS95135.1 Exopolysaccharide biosynthesis protein YbjH [Alloyangia pacifica]
MARRAGIAAMLAGATALAGAVQADTVPSFNLYGLPGLIDMPDANMAPDATLGMTYGRIGTANRGSVSFQIAPRLIGTFRYTGIEDFDHNASVDGVYYDRSFDLRFQILTEGTWRPSVVLGLQDFIGTGIYSGEYLVATKTVAPGWQVTGGLGWGRLGSYNGFDGFGERSAEVLGTGGQPTTDRWFRGDIAPFGGVAWSPNERLTFKVEYSSDAYDIESEQAGFEHNSPINLGMDYRFAGGTQLSLYYAHGSTLGAQLTYAMNPRTLGVPGGVESAPDPVSPRSPAETADLGWTTDLAAAEASTQARLARSLERERLDLEGFDLEPHRATLRLRNTTYSAPAQAIGRAARVMSRVLPGSVEEFVIVPSENGMPTSAVTLRRSDLEALENEAAVEMLARARFDEAPRDTPAMELAEYPRFLWSLAPSFGYATFDPDGPLRIDLGASLRGEVQFTPNIIFSGSINKKIVGNLDEITRESASELPRVRTDYAEYAREADPRIPRLTLAFYGKPASQFYSRLTVGYLEAMYAGASAELLWKPMDSRLAIGAEINYVERRDYDMLFGLQGNETTDPVTGITRSFPHVNGHVSAYYDFGKGYNAQLDVGRYLAGDTGATLTFTREFVNGWRIGAFATVTDVSADDFGEGSFDKGLIFTIPLSVGTGKPSRNDTTLTIRSVQRDGGARLSVDNRLYERIRENHEPDAAASWGRFWR